MTTLTAARHGLLLLAGVLVLAACGDSNASDPSTPRPPADGLPTQTVGPTPTATAELTPEADQLGTAGAVTAVVDGDTIEVDGQRVRVIGIDAAEVGGCGYAEATAAMTALVSGSTVLLTPVDGGDDRDRYDRLLRYVDVDGVDAGLSLIEQGLAVARYDSRDGYGGHPREQAYIDADADTQNRTCPEAPPPATDGGDCDAAYPGVCIPTPPPDLDCGQISERRFQVLPPDPHLFDTDGDGLGCESG